jgi:hypothetical protein
MWIRTQDKLTLIDITGMNLEIKVQDQDIDTYCIRARYHNNFKNNIYLGRGYHQKGRVIQILDDIQRAINYHEHFKHSGVNNSLCQNINYSVFQMPDA